MSQLTRSVHAAAIAIAPAGTIGTPHAHKAFATPAWTPDGMVHVSYRRGTREPSPDGSFCLLQRSPGGTWGSEQVIIDGTLSNSIFADPSIPNSPMPNGYRPGVRDVHMKCLPSGRLVAVVCQHKTGLIEFSAGVYDTDKSDHSWAGWFMYSDPPYTSWSTPTEVTFTGAGAPSFPQGCFPDDIIEFPSGNLLISFYALTGDGIWRAYGTRSTDEGATWAYRGRISDAIGGYNSLETSLTNLPDGTTLATLHTEDANPAMMYRTVTADEGATWATPTSLGIRTRNRNSVLAHPDGDVILAHADSSNVSNIRQSWNSAVSFGSAIPVDSSSAHPTYFGPDWVEMCFMGAAGVSPNLAVVTGYEGTGQASASVYFATVTRGSDVAPPAPVVASTTVADVTETAAAVSGTVDPNDLATTYRVEYGETTSYGSATAWESAGSGGTPVSVEITLADLASGTEYHARIVARSVAGTTNGADVTFTTEAPPPTPDVGLTLGESGVWAQTGTTITARALIGRRSTVTAVAYSENGGPVLLDGEQADRFDIDGEDTITLEPLTPTTVELGVTPLEGDDTLTVRIGVPL